MGKSEKKVIIERVFIGNMAKVSAIDPVTGLEGVVITPYPLAEDHQDALAFKKLQYVLKKEKDAKIFCLFPSVKKVPSEVG